MAPALTKGHVMLLHGLARSAVSMRPMARALTAAGYRVCNFDYPSRRHPVETLAARFMAPAIAEFRAGTSQSAPLHFVTHSMGGILLRQLAASGQLDRIGRVVMLGPPNHGSEVVDALGKLWLFQRLNGPAGNQLGTGATSLPRSLPLPDFELGVIAGTRSINLLLSLLLPKANDGKVSVASTQLQGMRDFLALPVTHPLMMRNASVIRQTLNFLDQGRFQHN